MPSADLQTSVANITVPPTLRRRALVTFRAELATALADESVRVVVLQGNRGHFCAGMDLTEVADDSDDATPPTWQEATHDFTAALQTILESIAITMAVVEGSAMGDRFGLAAAYDVVLATDEATFALPELVLGLVPAMILPALAERLGLYRAKRWAMTQATWLAGEAKGRRLVDEVVLKKRLDTAVMRTLRSQVRLHATRRHRALATGTQARTLRDNASHGRGASRARFTLESTLVASRRGCLSRLCNLAGTSGRSRHTLRAAA